MRFWIRIFVALLLSVGLSLHGWKKKSLDYSGCFAAFFVGFGSLATSYRFGLLLLLFYYSSSKLTKRKEDIKAKLEEDYCVGGQRNYIQVFANSILAVIACLLYYYYFGEDENINFMNSKTYLASQLSCLIVAHFACANGDTWASEMGILSPSKPRLITSFFIREVPPGTNGGMSFQGTMSSIAGGAFIGFVYYVCAFLYASEQWNSVFFDPQLGFMTVFGGICGMIGSMIDSLLGATLQASYYSKDRKLIVKHYDLKKDPSIIVICGSDILSNEAVNFVSIAITMLFSWLVAPIFFSVVASNHK
jgi:uncharacterized protein (TIGR00297 family)